MYAQSSGDRIQAKSGVGWLHTFALHHRSEMRIPDSAQFSAGLNFQTGPILLLE
jgi:hypothetical protein